MKVALFGKRIDKSNVEKLLLLVDELCRVERVEFCYHSSFMALMQDYNLNLPAGEVFASNSDMPKDIHLFFSLGGDGTFLESLTTVRDSGVPIAGINFGRLGFLTTACVGESNPWIEQLLKGNYDIEERALLKLAKDTLPDNFYPYALNEITIQRVTPTMLELNLVVDGQKLPNYWADGIVIASATGSTAYSLSIGGPVVTPDSKVLIIAPIAPHNLNVRPLIVPDNSVIEISFRGRNPQALLTVDNRSFTIEAEERVTITKGEFPVKSISVDNNFIAALNQKLFWGEDKRNSQ